MSDVSSRPGEYWDPNRWGPAELVGHSWERFKEDWPVLVGSLFVGWLIVLVVVGPLFAFSVATGGRGVHPLAFLVIGAAGYVVGSAIQAGLITVYVASARAERPELGLLFTGMKAFGRLLGVVLLRSLIVLAGTLLFVVPGILAAIGLFCAPYWAVDAELGPVDALKASWESSRGHWWNIFLFFLLCFGLMLAGEITCGVGLLIALPLVFLSQAMLYLRLSEGAVERTRPAQASSDASKV